MSLMVFRSDLLRCVRDYFYATGGREVLTPVLGSTGTSEIHLQNLPVQVGGETRYLQTSPEFAMKCLLAEYREDIFQVGPAFRGGENGHRHRAEFLMLEWYRCGMSLAGLMDDTSALWSHLGEHLMRCHELPGWSGSIRRVAYRDLFEEHFGFNPHSAALPDLVEMCRREEMLHIDQFASLADCLDALFSARVEPLLQDPVMVYDYPACQSALAELKTDSRGDTVSDRFEFYAGGIELANAYQELTDAAELKRRFDDNNRFREAHGRPVMADDQGLIAAMQDMPRSAGIALGLERLMMALLDVDRIEAVSL